MGDTKQGDVRLEDILVFRIGEGILMIIPDEASCDFSYVLSETNKCYRRILYPNEVDKNLLPNTNFEVECIENLYYLTIGAIKFQLIEEKRDQSNILNNLKKKKESLDKEDYARKAKYIEGDLNSKVTDLAKGCEWDNGKHTTTPFNDYLVYEFPSCTINYVSFCLWNNKSLVIHTYCVEVYSDGKWIPVATNQLGNSCEKISFSPICNATKIRFCGYSTFDNCLRIHGNNFSIKYVL